MKALILTLATLLPLMAQDSTPPAAPKGHRGERFALPSTHALTGIYGQALNLTADQKTKLHELRGIQRTANAPKRQAAQATRAAFGKAMQDPATPEATLRELHLKASEAHFQVLLAGRGNLAQVRALLTPEQREKASALFASHREQLRGRMRLMRMALRD